MEPLEQRVLLSGTNQAPNFDQQVYDLGVPVDASDGTVLGTLSASDADGDAFSFELSDVFGQSAFTVDDAGNVILTDSEAIGRLGVGGEYHVSALVSDGDQVGVATIAVTVGEASVAGSNSSPTFDAIAVGYNIAVDAESGEIGSIVAQDTDGDTLTYSGYEFEYGLVEITSSGSLVLDSTRLSELSPGTSVEFLAYADDGSSQTALPITLTLTESQAELTNHAPVFGSGQYSFDVPLDTTQGLIIGTLDATDADNDSVTFSLDDSSTQEAIALDVNGNLFVRSTTALSALSQGSVTLSATVSDQFDSTTSQVSINVTPPGDTVGDSDVGTPLFRQGSYAFHVPIDSGNGSIIGTVDASSDSVSVIYGGENDIIRITEQGNVVVKDSAALSQMAIGNIQTVIATASTDVAVGSVEILLTVSPSESFDLYREFQNATQALQVDADYDSFIADSPLSNRLSAFSDILTVSINESETAVADAESESDNAQADSEANPSGSGYFGVSSQTADGPSVYQFLPEPIQFTSLSLPLQDQDDPAVHALSGTESFSVSSSTTVTTDHSDPLVNEALPGLVSAGTSTATHSQEYESENQYVVTQSVTNSHTHSLQSSPSGGSTNDTGQGEDSDSDDASAEELEEDFSTTATETFTVSVVDGTQTIYTYTVTNSVWYSVGDLPGITDQDRDQPLGVPDGWSDAIQSGADETRDSLSHDENGDADSSASDQLTIWDTVFPETGDDSAQNSGDEGNAGPSEGTDGGNPNSSADEPEVESSSQFGAVFQSISTITVTLVESTITLPDGSSGVSYSLSFAPSFSTDSHAAGQSNFSSTAGELEQPSDGPDGGDSPDGDPSDGDSSDGESGGGTDSGGSGDLPGDDFGPGPDNFGPGPGDDESGGGDSAGDTSEQLSEDDDLPAELDTSTVEGNGNGHSLEFNNNFLGYSSSSVGLDIGLSMTVADGASAAQQAPTVSMGSSVTSNSGGLQSSGLNAVIQESSDTGYQYVSFDSNSSGGGQSGFGYGSQTGGDSNSSLTSSGQEATNSTEFTIGDSSYENSGGSVQVINSQDYTDANGDHIVKRTVMASGGSAGSLAEFGFDEGAITDTVSQSGNSTHHFLKVSEFSSGGPETNETSNQTQLSATFDFSGESDGSSSPLEAALGLNSSSGESSRTDEIKYRNETKSLVADLPWLPDVLVDHRTSIEMDITLDVSVGDGGVGGSLTSTTVETVDSVVRGFYAGQTATANVDGSIGELTDTEIPDDIHSSTTTTETHDLSSPEAGDILVGIGILPEPPRPQEDILDDYQSRKEQRLRMQMMLEVTTDPAMRAHLQEAIALLDTEISDLEAEAEEAGVTSEQLGAACAAATAAAAEFDVDAYLDRLDEFDRLQAESEEAASAEAFWMWTEIGMHGTQAAAEVAGGIGAVLIGGAPIAVGLGIAGAVRGLDHALTGILQMDGVDRETFLNQAITGITGSDAAGSVGETAFDIGLVVANTANMIRSLRNARVPDCGSSTCFIAGTQVVVNDDIQSPVSAFVPTRVSSAEQQHDNLDAYFASGALVLGTGLLLERRRRKRRDRGIRPSMA